MGTLFLGSTRSPEPSTETSEEPSPKGTRCHGEQDPSGDNTVGGLYLCWTGEEPGMGQLCSFFAHFLHIYAACKEQDWHPTSLWGSPTVKTPRWRAKRTNRKSASCSTKGIGAVHWEEPWQGQERVGGGTRSAHVAPMGASPGVCLFHAAPVLETWSGRRRRRVSVTLWGTKG